MYISRVIKSKQQMNYNFTISERQDRGEVITPESLVEEMLDKLPREVFKSKTTTFLDPCFGTGSFLKGVVLRLSANGHSTENINSRVFGFEINNKMFNETKRKFRGINIVKQDFLNTDINMKFDVIVGNPPYQDSNKTSGKNSSLWTKFIIKADNLLNKDGYLLYITPLSWIAPTSAQKKQLKSVFTENNLIYLDTSCKKYFNVGSTFSYYLIKKDSNYTSTNINGELHENLKIPFLPIVINDITISITKKIFNSFNETLDFSSAGRSDIAPNGPYMIYDINDIKRSDKLGKNYNIKKVVVNKPGYLNPKYDDGLYSTSSNNYWVPVASKKEADNIISFINSNIGKIILENLYKYSGYNSLGVLSSLPSVIKFNTWAHREDFKKVLNLTEKEIDYIENAVK